MPVRTLVAVFVLSAVALVHSYILYPALLALRSLVTRSTSTAEPSSLPSVALVIAAYNEEDVIAEKLENSLSLDYPEEKLSIVVFSDASSDDTDEIVRSYADRGVDLVRIEGRVGKTECQNRVVERLDEKIVVFSDANSMYDADAIRKLVAGFDSGVGCVIGELTYGEDSDVEGESVYWRYESLIKRLESALNSVVTGNGSIYAVRTDSYVPLDADAISDFAEPLSIVRNGEAVKYVPEAVAREQTGESVDDELERRSRIVTRSWHTVADNVALLNPLRYPVFSFQLASHKVLRWLSPVFMGAAFLANLGLALVSDRQLYRVAFGAQLAFYALAAVGAVFDRTARESPTIVHVPYYFLVANYGMLVGLWNFIRGENIVTWETAERDSTQHGDTNP